MTDASETVGGVEQIRAALGSLRVHDVSPLLTPELPMWFLHQAPRIDPSYKQEEVGFSANVVTLAEHTGTHVDAPSHFAPDGPSIDQVPADALLMRPYKKFDLTGDDHQPGDLIGAGHLSRAQRAAGFTLESGDVAVLEVGWDKYLPGGSDGRDPAWWGSNQPGLAPAACEFLAESGVVAVASDTAACDVAVKEGEIVSGYGHSDFFLPRGILIVEGLNGLAAVPATGLIAALPLKIAGGTGSPLRIVMLTEQQ